MSLWIELHSALEEAYAPNENVFANVYRYARWCVHESKNADASTAAVVAFYEHLPQSANVRRDLPNRLARNEFMQLGQAFRYLLSPKEYESFEQEYLKASKK